MAEILIISGCVLLALAAVLRYREQMRRSVGRLLRLAAHEADLRDEDAEEEIDWARSGDALESISDRFGKAGYFTKAERRKAKTLRAVILLGVTGLGAYYGAKFGGPMVFFGGIAGLYLGLMVWLYYLRYRTNDFRREVMFQLPLVLESLILLVESGLGILPAIERIVSVDDKQAQVNPVIRLLRLVYELSAHGMPFGDALELVANAADLKVLRHVLLHLDISGTEGGELVPSLRSLSDHSHTEWKLTVEQRVKRLENAVVFPVFAAVLGLICLTAAVPMVPVLEFRDKLEGNNTSIGQRGNVTLYSLIILPVVVTLSVLVVDVSGWYSLREATQREADAIAFRAAQALPDQTMVLSAISEAVVKSDFPLELADIAISGSRVNLMLRSEYHAVFDHFLEMALGEAGRKVFSVVAQGDVQVVPTDYVVILADGQTLRPGLQLDGAGAFQDVDEPWGNATEWPASNLFNQASYPAAGDVDDDSQSTLIDWSAQWGDVRFRRWLTQACFNPVLSNLKLAAISLVDALGSSPINRVGVVFTPGDNNSLDLAVARYVRGRMQTADGTVYYPDRIGGFPEPDVTVEAQLSPYIDYQLRTGAGACMLYSHPQIDGRYSLAPLPENFGIPHNPSNCQEQAASIPFGQPFDPFHAFSSCYLDNTLRLREAIYWNPAKRAEGTFNATPDIYTAIESAIVDLVNTGNDALLEAEIARRGNVGYEPHRKIIVMSDVLPSPSDARFADIQALLQSSNSQVILVPYEHQQLAATELDELRARSAEFTSVAETIGQSVGGVQTLRVLPASSVTELRTEIVPKLVALGREIALRQ